MSSLQVDLPLKDRELARLDELCRQKELPRGLMLVVALRHYADAEAKMAAGETLSWSGDVDRAARFAGPVPDELEDFGLSEVFTEYELNTLLYG